MKKIIILLLLINNLNASIIKSIDIGIKSYHLGKYDKTKSYYFNNKQFTINSYSLNENNLGIFFNTDFYNLSFGYINKNSYGNKMYLLGFNKEIYKKEDFSIELKLYGVYGYKKFYTTNTLKQYEVDTKKYYNENDLNNVVYKYNRLKEKYHYYFVKKTTMKEKTDIPLYKGLSAFGSVSLKYKYLEVSFIPNVVDIKHSIIYTGFTFAF